MTVVCKLCQTVIPHRQGLFARINDSDWYICRDCYQALPHQERWTILARPH